MSPTPSLNRVSRSEQSASQSCVSPQRPLIPHVALVPLRKGERLSSLQFCFKGSSFVQNFYKETETSTAAVLARRDLCLQCVKTFVWEGDVTGIQWVGTRGVATHPTRLRAAPPGQSPPQMSTVLRRGAPACTGHALSVGSVSHHHAFSEAHRRAI